MREFLSAIRISILKKSYAGEKSRAVLLIVRIIITSPEESPVTSTVMAIGTVEVTFG
jgi:hypothetical protein